MKTGMKVTVNNSGIYIKKKEGCFFFQAVKENIIRCVYFKGETYSETSPLEIHRECSLKLHVEEADDEIRLSAGRLMAIVKKATGSIYWYQQESGRLLLAENRSELQEIEIPEYGPDSGEPRIERVKTVDGERAFVKNLMPLKWHGGYRGKLFFHWKDGERIHGLGQGEEGIYNYRGNIQYLYQHNMRIPIPFFLSDEGYGVLADCGSLMVWNDDARGSYLLLDAVQQLDYYLIAGENPDEIIAGYRTLTGRAAMLPKWAFGYWQSKEAYRTQEELTGVVAEYRAREIPLDGIIQDWNTWREGEWGEKLLDKERYPDFPAAVEQIHRLHAHVMVSVWPNMNQNTRNYREFLDKGQLLYDFSTYNAFSQDARETYWKQLKEELYAAGVDGWWCDSTEPFSAPDWGGAYLREPWERYRLVGEEHKKFLGAEQANLFSLAHAKGIFENQRKEGEKKRVLNLTRSGYAGSQKYGTVLWSGDICATWDTLKRQIREGLNMCMSGMPYWTLDIGGFFVVKEEWRRRGCNCQNDPAPKWFWQGGYEDGVADLGYRELYVRWLQYGVFLPVFRSHGTDTPREIWNFGEPGECFYEAIAESIRLRYRLLPYIYSMAGKVYHQNRTIMRSLLFDFSEDEKSKDIDMEFLFGENLLICPITEPMFYEAGSRPMNGDRTWNCYLPKGIDWYDFYTGERYAGGSSIKVEARLERIPVFVRAGSILVMEQGLQYADQDSGSPLEIVIYPGCDVCYEYYEDSGDGYGYEKGEYQMISLLWEDAHRKITIGNAKYSFPQGMKGRRLRICLGDMEKWVSYDGIEVVVSFE